MGLFYIPHLGKPLKTSVGLQITVRETRWQGKGKACTSMNTTHSEIIKNTHNI